MPGETVMADAQFGITRILRPFAGFEAVYGGQPAAIPIMVTELGEPRDPLAGDPGYAPNLLRGLSVPLGARAFVWLPNIFASKQGGAEVPLYKWFFWWRLRNTSDFRRRRAAYHYPKQGAGQPSFPGPSPRVVIPGAYHCAIVNQDSLNPGSADATTTSGYLNQTVNPETFDPARRTIVESQPLMPDGTFGVAQQGILPNAPLPFSNIAADLPAYYSTEIQVEGDELLVGVTRNMPVDGPNWEFGAGQYDRFFSAYLGNGQGQAFPDVGVYVMTGTAP